TVCPFPRRTPARRRPSAPRDSRGRRRRGPRRGGSVPASRGWADGPGAGAAIVVRGEGPTFDLRTGPFRNGWPAAQCQGARRGRGGASLPGEQVVGRLPDGMQWGTVGVA